MAEFNLLKVKKIKDGGLHVEWETTIEDDGSIVTINKKEDRPVNPHKDFFKALDGLKEPVLKALGFYELQTIEKKGTLAKADIEAFTKLNKYIKGVWENNLRKLEITGISLSGEDLNKVVVTFKFDDITGKAMGMSSPLFHMDQDRFGFESSVQDSVDMICEETEEYILNGKKTEHGQTDIEAES